MTIDVSKVDRAPPFVDDASDSRSLRLRTYAWVLGLVYFVTIGGTPTGDALGATRAFNLVIATVLIILWSRALLRDHDRTDELVLLAVVLFMLTCLTSSFARQSFEASVQAVALASAYYFGRRDFRHDYTRNMVLLALGLLGVTLAIGLGMLWLLTWLNWLAVSQWTVWPPLSLSLPTGIVSHRHEAALMLALLYPALWTSPFRRLRWIPSIAATPFLVAVIVMDGSRTVWMALAVATLLIAIPSFKAHLAQIDKHLAILVAVVLLAVILLAVVATPLGNGLYLRMSNLLTLSARGNLWSAAASLWGTHPVTGLGPGSFPFAYLLTDYFQFSGWDPRNPDNGLVQLITETGMLGVAAAGSVILAVVRAIRKFPHRRLELWALIVFMFATIGMNPTDFLYLLVIALAWAAMATLPTTSVSSAPSRAFPLVRSLAAICLLAAALLVGTSGVAYDISRSAYQRGDRAASESILLAAAFLDPNQAIYLRERAALRLERGDFDDAIAGYRRVLALAPVDEAAKRGLALALTKEGESSAALAEIQGAVNRQRFSDRNTLLLAVIASHVGDMSTATRAFEEFLALSPSAALSPRWPISVTGSREEVIEAAVSRGLANTRASFGLNLTYLALATGNSQLVDLAANAVIPELARSASSLQSLARCNPAEAWEVIEPAYREEGSNGAYWITRAIIAMIAETDSAQSRELARLYAGAPEQPGAGTMLADGFGDIYKYRRLPFYVQDGLSAEIRTLQEPIPLSVVAPDIYSVSCRSNS